MSLVPKGGCISIRVNEELVQLANYCYSYEYQLFLQNNLQPKIRSEEIKEFESDVEFLARYAEVSTIVYLNFNFNFNFRFNFRSGLFVCTVINYNYHNGYDRFNSINQINIECDLSLDIELRLKEPFLFVSYDVLLSPNYQSTIDTVSYYSYMLFFFYEAKLNNFKVMRNHNLGMSCGLTNFFKRNKTFTLQNIFGKKLLTVLAKINLRAKKNYLSKEEFLAKRRVRVEKTRQNRRNLNFRRPIKIKKINFKKINFTTVCIQKKNSTNTFKNLYKLFIFNKVFKKPINRIKSIQEFFFLSDLYSYVTPIRSLDVLIVDFTALFAKEFTLFDDSFLLDYENSVCSLQTEFFKKKGIKSFKKKKQFYFVKKAILKKKNKKKTLNQLFKVNFSKLPIRSQLQYVNFTKLDMPALGNLRTVKNFFNLKVKGMRLNLKNPRLLYNSFTPIYFLKNNSSFVNRSIVKGLKFRYSTYCFYYLIRFFESICKLNI